VVDEDRVLRLLRSIADDAAVLRQEAGAGQERRQDPIWLRGVRYTFVTAIEACVDVAQHICATEGWRPPAANGDAVGFRNVLVPDYIEVDDSMVVDRLTSLSDLEEFVSQVAAYVTITQSQPEPPRQPAG
jgi:uncharacterized protein YutE (UPF0331/DUF86 family)